MGGENGVARKPQDLREDLGSKVIAKGARKIVTMVRGVAIGEGGRSVSR